MNQKFYRLFAFILCFFLSCSQSIGSPIGVTPRKIDIDPNQMIALLGQKRSSPQFNSLLLKLAGNNPALLKYNRFSDVGIEFQFDENEILYSIHAFRDSLWNCGYAGVLPGGVTLTDSKEQLYMKLGKPHCWIGDERELAYLETPEWWKGQSSERLWVEKYPEYYWECWEYEQYRIVNNRKSNTICLFRKMPRPVKLSPIDPKLKAELPSYLKKNIKDPDVQSFLKNLGPGTVVQTTSTSECYSYPNACIVLYTYKGIINSIKIYRTYIAGQHWMYSGPLPNGLNWLDNSEQVQSKIGLPNNFIRRNPRETETGLYAIYTTKDGIDIKIVYQSNNRQTDTIDSITLEYAPSRSEI